MCFLAQVPVAENCLLQPPKKKKIEDAPISYEQAFQHGIDDENIMKHFVLS